MLLVRLGCVRTQDSSQFTNAPKVLHSAVSGVFEAQQWQLSTAAVEMGQAAPSHVEMLVNSTALSSEPLPDQH